MCLLSHKIIKASMAEGIQEGQLLLQDWLVILISQFKKATMGKQGGDSLQKLQIARHVYAMLTSPLLASRVNPDRRVYTQHLYARLEPDYLVRALYPKLSSFTSFDKEEHEQLYLQRKAVEGLSSGALTDRIYLIDTLHEILVLCTADESRTDIVFPPQMDCLLKQKIAECKLGRPVAPVVSWMRFGVPEMAHFENHLIEESDVSGIGYENFVKYINDEVEQFLAG